MAYDFYSERGMTEREYFYAEVLPFRIALGIAALIILGVILSL